jgi:hypothetical protein
VSNPLPCSEHAQAAPPGTKNSAAEPVTKSAACYGKRFQRFLVLRLPLTPELENAFPDPEKAQAVKEEAQNAEIPQEYRIAYRESNADKDDACNNAFHRFLNNTARAKAFPMPVKFQAYWWERIPLRPNESSSALRLNQGRSGMRPYRG